MLVVESVIRAAVSGAKRRAADQAHRSESAEAGVVADERGAGREADRIAGGALLFTLLSGLLVARFTPAPVRVA